MGCRPARSAYREVETAGIMPLPAPVQVPADVVAGAINGRSGGIALAARVHT